MQVILNDEGYVLGYAVVGSFNEGFIAVEKPDNFEDFEKNFKSYVVSDGKLIKDEKRQLEIENMYLLNDLRRRREKECFQYINRGELWYGRLSDAQKEELRLWYDAWLNVTETKVEPIAPEWLDRV